MSANDFKPMVEPRSQSLPPNLNNHETPGLFDNIPTSSPVKTPKRERDTTPNVMSTPNTNATDMSPPTSNRKGRRPAEDGQKRTAEEIAKLKADVLANGGETFNCEYPGGCNTGQVDMKDSRLCVSDYFGRNKAATTKIAYQIRWCRKHYQRFSYLKAIWQINKISLIREQLTRIEEQEAGTTYDISLKKSEQDRLSTFNNTRGAVASTSLEGLKTGQSPIPILQHIFDNYVGKYRTKTECEALIQWCESEIAAENIKNVPSFEMVPNFSNNTTSAGPSTPKNKTAKPGTPASRATRSGGIKKIGA